MLAGVHRNNLLADGHYFLCSICLSPFPKDVCIRTTPSRHIHKFNTCDRKIMLPHPGNFCHVTSTIGTSMDGNMKYFSHMRECCPWVASAEFENVPVVAQQWSFGTCFLAMLYLCHCHCRLLATVCKDFCVQISMHIIIRKDTNIANQA